MNVMSTLRGLICVLCIRATCVVTVSLCYDSNYLELKVDRDDNRFVCTGLTGQQTVSWFSGQTFILKCTASSCDVNYVSTHFQISRTSPTESDITVNVTAFSDLNSSQLSNLTCQVSNDNKDTCQLDVVYPAENSRCQVQFNGNIWLVTISCSVSKARSARNNYRCFLYQVSEAFQATSLGSYTMDVVQGQSGYVSGTCNMTSFLPPEGRYSYYVIIMPGQVNTPATFIGNNTISRPKSAPKHSCPLYVREDDPVTCVCSVDDLGSPPGRLAWNNTNSEQLILPRLKMDQHGENYVCKLTWNKTVVQLVTYTLLIAYPPTQMSFKLNSDSENAVVPEKSPVTMVCQSDGRPTPNMTITDITNGNRVVHSLPGGNVTLANQRVEIRYVKAVVQCEDAGEYNCSADSVIGRKYQAVTLFVKCSPRRNPADANDTTPTVEEGNSATIELIAYPTSVNVTKYFLGPNNGSNETNAREGVFLVGCILIPPSSYKIICTITVNNVTSDTAGFYKVIVINQEGNVSFVFQALPQNTTTQEGTTVSIKSEESLVGAIAGGVVGGVVVVGLVTLAVVCFVRQKGKKNKNKLQSQKSRNVASRDSDSVLTPNAIYESSDTRPLASEQNDNRQSGKAPLSMFPVKESAYENEAFHGDSAKIKKNKGKGVEEARRRNNEGLNYTTVVFSSSPNTQPQTQKLDPTEYATIRQARDH